MAQKKPFMRMALGGRMCFFYFFLLPNFAWRAFNPSIMS